MKTDKIELEIETKGFEEATDKLQKMTDAMSNMPSQVVIRNCRDCVINVHPSQTIIGNFDDDEGNEEE